MSCLEMRGGEAGDEEERSSGGMAEAAQFLSGPLRSEIPLSPLAGLSSLGYSAWQSSQRLGGVLGGLADAPASLFAWH